MFFLSSFFLLSTILYGYYDLKKSNELNFTNIFFIYFLVSYPLLYFNILFFSNILPNNTILLNHNFYLKIIIQDSIFFLLVFLFKNTFFEFSNINSHYKFFKNLRENIKTYTIIFITLYILLNFFIFFIDNKNIERILNYSIDISLILSLSFLIILLSKNKLYMFTFIFIIFSAFLIFAFFSISGKGYIKDFLAILIVLNVLNENKFFKIFKNKFFILFISFLFLHFLIVFLETTIKVYDENIFDIYELFTPIASSEIYNTIRIYSHNIDSQTYPLLFGLIDNILPNNIFLKDFHQTPTIFFENIFNYSTPYSIKSTSYEYYSGLGLGFINFLRLYSISYFDFFSILLISIFILCIINFYINKIPLFKLFLLPLFIISLHRLLRTDIIHFLNTFIFLCLGVTILLILFILFKLIYENFFLKNY